METIQWASIMACNNEFDTPRHFFICHIYGLVTV